MFSPWSPMTLTFQVCRRILSSYLIRPITCSIFDHSLLETFSLLCHGDHIFLFYPTSLGVSSLSFNVFIILHSQYPDVSLDNGPHFCSLSHVMESHAFKFSLKISSSQIYISNHSFFPEVHIPISNIEVDDFIGCLTSVLCSTVPTLIYRT